MKNDNHSPLNGASREASAGPSETEIRGWMVSYLSDLLEIGPDEVDVEGSLQGHGLDSSGAVGMIGDLGAWLDRKIDPELAYSYPSVATLARHLAREGAAPCR